MAPSATVTCLVIRQAVRARERYTAPCCSVFNVVAGFLCICKCNKPVLKSYPYATRAHAYA